MILSGLKADTSCLHENLPIASPIKVRASQNPMNTKEEKRVCLYVNIQKVLTVMEAKEIKNSSEKEDLLERVSRNGKQTYFQKERENKKTMYI